MFFSKLLNLRSGLKVFFKPRTLDESAAKSQETRQLLIVGLSRSGTSLLQRLLNAYPSVFIAYESIYMPFLGENNREDVHAYYYEILKQHRHLCLAAPDRIPPEAVKGFSFLEHYDYFGDKAIYNTGRQFRRRLRRAVKSGSVDKIIFIMRDPRARVLSFLKWKEKRDTIYTQTVPAQPTQQTDKTRIIEQCGVWNTYVGDVCAYTEQSSKCMFVTYEELVREPKASIDHIMAFLNLKPDKYPFVNLDTIKPDSLSKWRDALSSESIAQIDTITKKYREKLGYE